MRPERLEESRPKIAQEIIENLSGFFTKPDEVLPDHRHPRDRALLVHSGDATAKMKHHVATVEVEIEVEVKDGFIDIVSVMTSPDRSLAESRKLKKDWREGQQIPEQAGYSPHPIAAEATHAEADLPNVPPASSSIPHSAQKSTPSRAAKIEDFGEKLEGARKDMEAALRKEYSDDELASLPLSKIWPTSEVDAIEDKFIAAVAFAAREAIPAKPRVKYKVMAWVAKVRMFRDLMLSVLGKVNRDQYMEKMRDVYALRNFRSKVELLESIDRSQWKRIGLVGVYPDAYKMENGKHIPSPYVSVNLDGRSRIIDNASDVEDALSRVNELLGVEQQAPKMKFTVRGRDGRGYFIHKEGDSEYRKLKTFETSQEALEYRRQHYDDLVAAWEAVKERDNVKEKDLRSGENRPRSGQDWRKGKDVTPEQFVTELGFRGGQFGNWVSQGEGAKERQGLLNQAYDALMDLANIAGIPPKAISLNEELGIAFGARGHGWASAHYEPDTLVINLTKTRGAGALAHEWFHALDHYFRRHRGPVAPFTGDQDAYRKDSYITYRPEAMMVRKDGKGAPISRVELAQKRELNPNADYFKSNNWIVDPNHPQGVRPEVEARFAELVNALNDSPMAARAKLIDKSPEGYWSRIIERAARSFENYVISRMMRDGYHNDYLANVTRIEDFARDPDRYPYLLDSEMGPVAEAFDSLFETIETRETDRGVAMFSRSQSTQEAYEARIDELFAGDAPNNQDGVRVLDRSDLLDMLGYGDYDVVLAEKHAVAEMNHGLTPSEWKKLPEWLDDPVAVIRRDDGNIDFIGPDLGSGKVALIGVKPEIGKAGSRGEKKLHLVLTAIDKSKSHISVDGRPAEDGLLYVNTRKSPAFNRGSRRQLPSNDVDLRGFGRKIHTDSDLRKYRATHPPKMSRGDGAEAGHTLQSIHPALSQSLESVQKGLSALLDAPWVHIVNRAQLPMLLAKGGVNASQADGMDFVQEVLAELSAVDEFFRYRVSDKNDLPGIMKDVMPGATYLGEDTRADEKTESGADKRHVFKAPSGALFYVYERGKDDVWIDVSRLKEGDQGSAIYHAVSNYAYNTDKQFIGDPEGLSEAAVVRRTSNMLSSVLRFGTTRHLEAAPEQIRGDKKKGIEPLDWRSDDVAKTRALIHTFLATLHNQFPQLREYRYDFGRTQFVDSRGRPLDAARLERGERTPMARASRAGEATMRRGIFLQSLVASESGQRPRILEQVLRRSSQLVRNGHLDGLFSKDHDLIRAFVQNGHVYFVAENIPLHWSKDQLTGLVLHEISSHALRLGHSEPEYQSILADFKKMKARGVPLAVKAYGRVPSDTPKHLIDEEALSYSLEIAPKSTLAQRFLTWFRKALRAIGKTIPGMKRFAVFKWANGLTPEDLVGLATDALRQAGREIPRNLGQLPKGALFSKSTRGYDGGTFPISEANREKTQRLEEAIRLGGYDFAITPVAVPDAVAQGRNTDLGAAEKIARLFGKEVVWMRADGDFRINGVIHTKIAKNIYIDVRIDKLAHAVMGHELSHHLEQDAPDIYDDLMWSVSRVIKNYDGYRRKYGYPPSMSDESVAKEIVGDLMGDAFADPTFWRQVAKENPGAFRRIADAIVKWLDGLLGLAKKDMQSWQWVSDAKAARRAIVSAVAQYADMQQDGRRVTDSTMFSTRKDDGWYYSSLQRAFENAKQTAMPGLQWKAWLNSNAAKLGVKADEIQWSGINEYLELSKGKVSKADILGYLRGNGLRVDDVTLGDYSNSSAGEFVVPAWEGNMDDDGEIYLWDVWGNAAQSIRENDNTDDPYASGEYRLYYDGQDTGITSDDLGDLKDRAEENRRDEYDELRKLEDRDIGPKFAQYTPPGGKPSTYRELLLTLPQKTPEHELRSIAQMKEFLTQNKAIADSLEGLSDVEKLKQLNKRRAKEGAARTFQSSHFEQKNILAHLRVDEVEGANGERLLRVVEIQSDAGQDKRKGKTDWKAPFIDKTDAWVSLALKKAIAYAANNGMDGIVFATGAQNADLYDLSKQVDSVSYSDDGVLRAFRGRNAVITQNATESELPDIIGKEAAERLLNKKSEDGYRTISGIDLKVGGEGMRKFYDEIIPTTAVKVLRQLGVSSSVAFTGKRGSTVGTMISSHNVTPSSDVGLGSGGAPTTPDSFIIRAPLLVFETKNAGNLTGFPITPSLRAKAIDEGLPLFARLGVLYFGDPESMRQSLPKAYEAYHEIFREQRESPVNDSYVRGKIWTTPRWNHARGSDTRRWLEAAGRADGSSGAEQANHELERLRDAISKAFRADRLGGLTEGSHLEARDGTYSPREDIRFSKSRASWDSLEPSLLDNILHETQDVHIDTKRVIQQIAKAIGIIHDDANVRQAEELYSGRSSVRVEDFLKNEEKPLLQEMLKAGVDMGGLEAYLWARHAKEANAHIAKINPDLPDGGSGLTNQEADDYFDGKDVMGSDGEVRLKGMDATQAKRLERLAQMTDDIIANTRRLMVEYGLETQETIDTWANLYPHYVPLQRADMEHSMQGNGTGRGFKVRGQMIFGGGPNTVHRS